MFDLDKELEKIKKMQKLELKKRKEEVLLMERNKSIFQCQSSNTIETEKRCACV